MSYHLSLSDLQVSHFGKQAPFFPSTGIYLLQIIFVHFLLWIRFLSMICSKFVFWKCPYHRGLLLGINPMIRTFALMIHFRTLIFVFSINFISLIRSVVLPNKCPYKFVFRYSRMFLSQRQVFIVSISRVFPGFFSIPGTPVFLLLKIHFHVERLNISLWLGRKCNHFLRN